MGSRLLKISPNAESRENAKEEKPKTPFFDDGGFLLGRAGQTSFRFIKNRESLPDGEDHQFLPGGPSLISKFSAGLLLLKLVHPTWTNKFQTAKRALIQRIEWPK